MVDGNVGDLAGLAYRGPHGDLHFAHHPGSSTCNPPWAPAVVASPSPRAQRPHRPTGDDAREKWQSARSREVMATVRQRPRRRVRARWCGDWVLDDSKI